MNDLKTRVQKMLDGEQKRRDVALKFVAEVEGILLPVSEDIWGKHIHDCNDYIHLTTVSKENTKNNTDIRFRYNTYYDDSTWSKDYVGFYYGSREVEELRGKDFWYAIQVIMEWIPQVVEIMEKREISRNALLEKIK